MHKVFGTITSRVARESWKRRYRPRRASQPWRAPLKGIIRRICNYRCKIGVRSRSVGVRTTSREERFDWSRRWTVEDLCESGVIRFNLPRCYIHFNRRKARAITPENCFNDARADRMKSASASSAAEARAAENTHASSCLSIGYVAASDCFNRCFKGSRAEGGLREKEMYVCMSIAHVRCECKILIERDRCCHVGSRILCREISLVFFASWRRELRKLMEIENSWGPFHLHR